MKHIKVKPTNITGHYLRAMLSVVTYKEKNPYNDKELVYSTFLGQVKINTISFGLREIKTPYPFLCGIYIDHKMCQYPFK